MQQPTIEQFYEFLKDSVRYARQTGIKTDTLQTFAVVEDLVEVNSNSLNKNIHDKNKVYFYSRKWEQLKSNPSKLSFDYPALFVKNISYRLEGAFTNKKRECHGLELAFAYPYVENQSASKCALLSVGEIEKMSINFAMKTFDYLNNIVFCRYEKDGQVVEDFANKSVLLAQQTSGTITNLEILNSPLINAYTVALKKENKTINGGWLDFPCDAGILKGVTYTINYCTYNCNDFVFEVDETNCCVEGNVLT